MPILDLLRILHERKGSDLHLSPGNPPLCRINGTLQPVANELLTDGIVQSLMNEILNNEQRQRFLKTGDLDLGFEASSIGARFRINVFLGRLGMGAVFRRIPVEVLTAVQL